MTEQIIYRVNRVPDRSYVKFLELIGLSLFPPTAARAPVTFWLAAPHDNYDAADVFDQCVAVSCSSEGTPTPPMSLPLASAWPLPLQTKLKAVISSRPPRNLRRSQRSVSRPVDESPTAAGLKQLGARMCVQDEG